jgi:hypothetical protein
MIGFKVGFLEVIAETPERIRRSKLWLCQCECGSEVLVSTPMLKANEKKSCGCKTKAETSGMHGTPTHTIKENNMSFNFIDFLLNNPLDYNQHKTTEISGMSIETALNLCEELGDYTKHSHIFSVEAYADGSWNINQKDFFTDHPNGHRDRLVLGSDGVK